MLYTDAFFFLKKKDKKRINKSLYTNNPEGIPMSLISTANSQTEAEFVATEIKKAMHYSKGILEYKDFAVLMRMNFLSEKFEHAFREHNIPYTMVGGNRFFDRIEIKDMINYLMFCYNPNNVTAFARIVNVPRRGVGEVTLKLIVEANTRDNTDMMQTLYKMISSRSLPPATSNKVKDFYAICLEVQARMRDEVKKKIWTVSIKRKFC